eukprot:TRINITY_DN23000_c0_g1_i1.p1 TRINITY_DN23000_c0_g1~~TRINITY_DN23000_c0_g1_i1.p1  ORF type:complete len:114 (-),score=52.97 TRINITY_DN23000_c0_g1_i1:27-368(-)
MEALEAHMSQSNQRQAQTADRSEPVLRHMCAIARLVQSAANGRASDELQAVAQLEQDSITASQPDVKAMLGTLHTVAKSIMEVFDTVSYTHLRAHETVLDIVCRLLLEKKKKK